MYVLTKLKNINMKTKGVQGNSVKILGYRIEVITIDFDSINRGSNPLSPTN